MSMECNQTYTHCHSISTSLHCAMEQSGRDPNNCTYTYFETPPPKMYFTHKSVENNLNPKWSMNERWIPEFYRSGTEFVVLKPNTVTPRQIGKKFELPDDRLNVPGPGAYNHKDRLEIPEKIHIGTLPPKYEYDYRFYQPKLIKPNTANKYKAPSISQRYLQPTEFRYCPERKIYTSYVPNRHYFRSEPTPGPLDYRPHKR